MNEFEKEVQYRQEIFAQKTPYLQWLKQQEAEFCERYTQPSGVEGKGALGKQVYTLPFSSCMDSMQSCGEIDADGIYLFEKRGGSLSEYAVCIMQEAFSEQGDVVLVYADEDYQGGLRELYDIKEGFFDDAYYRGAPWFKPDFSPDTLASFFYIGSVFAIRGDTVLEIMAQYGRGISIYELVYRIFMDALQYRIQKKKEKIVHIPSILYTNNNLDEVKRIDCFDGNKELYGAEDAYQKKVSIVIPSKDNAKVLGKCLETLTKYTSYDNYEIIIVDNGSSYEQKLCITAMIDSLTSAWKEKKAGFHIQYIYEKMDFNFSAMCNIGAKAADGEYLLFLNDDIEVMDTGEGAKWLGYMVKYAHRHHVGAVGAKLYYPPGLEDRDSYRIQHVGITNMAVGPVHKLNGMPDKGCLYHGHNTQNYDMLAVTAACMLIRHSLFDEIGGFDPAFPVAYNDVAFCFALHLKGYFNVQVNDAVLIHHESLSRGQDTSPEKVIRLRNEKRKLYAKYPSLKAKDPFYSPNLVQWKKDACYNTDYLYEFDKIARPQCLERKDVKKILQKHYFRESLYRKSREAGRIYDKLTGSHLLMSRIDHIGEEDGIITIDGWCVQRKHDNKNCFRKIWLIHNSQDRKVYAFDVPPKLREDVEALFKESAHSVNNGQREKKKTKNVALSGVQLRFEKDKLEQGAYLIGIVINKKQLLCMRDENGNPLQLTISTGPDSSEKGVMEHGK